jgi:hypothetical protein
MSRENPTAAERARRRLRRAQRLSTRRREQVARLAAQIEILSEEALTPLERTVRDAPDPELALGEPTYTLAARLHRRANTTRVYTRERMREPILQLYAKLPAQRYAEQHGVRVPQILGRWPDPGEVDWDSLPDRFVLKSNIGGGGMNVFPLVRDPATGRFTDMLTGRPTTREEVLEKLWEKHEKRSSYFAEEFLVGRAGTPGAVPDDIKVFCFYGEPVYLEVRRGDQSRASDITQRVMAFSIDGTELRHVRALMDPGEGDIAVPEDFEAIADACRRLSGGIRRPLERLDFFETDQGLVFGEMTQNPGRPPALVPEWDRRMGEAYEAAYARLLTDVAAEGALHVDFGDTDPASDPGPGGPGREE